MPAPSFGARPPPRDDRAQNVFAGIGRPARRLCRPDRDGGACGGSCRAGSCRNPGSGGARPRRPGARSHALDLWFRRSGGRLDPGLARTGRLRDRGGGAETGGFRSMGLAMRPGESPPRAAPASAPRFSSMPTRPRSSMSATNTGKRLAIPAEAKPSRWAEAGAAQTRPVPGVVTGVRRLREAGTAVIFNSNRPASAAPGTIRALERPGPARQCIGKRSS